MQGQATGYKLISINIPGSWVYWVSSQPGKHEHTHHRVSYITVHNSVKTSRELNVTHESCTVRIINKLHGRGNTAYEPQIFTMGWSCCQNAISQFYLHNFSQNLARVYIIQHGSCKYTHLTPSIAGKLLYVYQLLYDFLFLSFCVVLFLLSH